MTNDDNRDFYMTAKLQKNHLLLYLFILMGLFILLELNVFIQGNGFYLGDFRLVAHHLKIPLTVLPAIIYFICVQIGIHLGYIFFIFGFSHLIGYGLKSSISQIEKIGISLWTMGIVTILLGNQYLFPNTRFKYVTYFITKIGMLNVVLFCCLLLCTGILLLAMWGSIKLVSQYRKKAFFIFVTSLLFFSSCFYFQRQAIGSLPTKNEKPNIILIGVDALRPDYLSALGSHLKTPHFDDFLNHATTFSESITPIARTYPAWFSILTGEYPKKNGVRFDLSGEKTFDLSQTLPAILKKAGYVTIYATDDVRFSNIDKTLGFEHFIIPPIGFNDFLLGTMNDFPLSNLLINTRIGRYLFPYSYSNRAAYITYEPDTFIHFLNSSLKKNIKPVFLAVHFCLPHLPYAWASYPNNRQFAKNYGEAVKRADQQVGDFLKVLKAHHLLDHSIVVLLSDHGEALELPGDRVTDANFYIPGKNNVKRVIPHFYPPSVKTELVNQSAGHGTDVLGMSQYHNTLAFRFYGLPGQVNTIVPGIVSLIDIKPTILNLLQIDAAKTSGQSLVDFISGKKIAMSRGDFFIESDFSPQAVRSVYPETRKLLFEGIDFFEINPKTTRLTVKKSMADRIIASKQYADINGKWILALYPKNKNQMTPILVNLKTGFWTDDLTTDFAKNAPVLHMLTALKTFYGSEIKQIQNK